MSHIWYKIIPQLKHPWGTPMSTLVIACPPVVLREYTDQETEDRMKRFLGENTTRL